MKSQITNKIKQSKTRILSDEDHLIVICLRKKYKVAVAKFEPSIHFADYFKFCREALSQILLRHLVLQVCKYAKYSNQPKALEKKKPSKVQ